MKLWVEKILHPSIQRIQTPYVSSFQMLQIYSSPTLDMSCCQSIARGKREIPQSSASICSMMYPRSSPENCVYMRKPQKRKKKEKKI